LFLKAVIWNTVQKIATQLRLGSQKIAITVVQKMQFIKEDYFAIPALLLVDMQEEFIAQRMLRAIEKVFDWLANA